MSVIIGIDLASGPDETALRLPCGTVLRGNEAIFNWMQQEASEEIARVFGIPQEMLQ